MVYRKLKKDKSPINATTYKMEELAEWISEGGSVGWIVSDGLVVVDVDNYEDSEIVKEMLDYTAVRYRCHTTPKGKHFIFKAGRNKIPQVVNSHTPVGLRVDTRVANKGYIVLPINDAKRSILVPTPLDEVDIIPFWLLPLKINTSNDDFVSRTTTVGRNDGLFKQVARLKSAMLKPEQIKVSVLLINQFVFPQPLPSHELETTVLREENLQVEDKSEHQLSHNEIAELLFEMYDIKYINDAFYIYNDGVYQNGREILENMMLDINPKIKDAARTEVFKYMAIRKRAEDSETPDYYVNLKNGIYSLKDAKLLPHSPEIAGRNRVTFEYTESKRVAAVDKFLLDIADGYEDRKTLILQMIGYAMTKSIREQKLFFLYGETASNGKSTLLRIISRLIGTSNVSTVSLDNINSNQFMLPELDNKLVNIYADLSNKFLSDVSIVKNIVTGDPQRVARKFGQPFDLVPYCKLIFSTNEMPKAGKDKGWYRRMLIIPFERQFKGNRFNEEDIKTPDALNYLGTLALNEYQKLYDLPANDDEKWADWRSSMDYLKVYKEETDNAYAFFNSLDISTLNCTIVDGERLYLKSDLFNKYKEFVEDNGFKEKSKISFGKTIREFLEDRMYNNKHWWIIKEREDKK